MSNNFSIERLVRSNVAAMKPYSSARDEFKKDGREMTFLDANENPFETGLNRYPDPQQEKLKAALAVSKKVNPGNILLGNGSDEVLDLILRAFCEPKQDNVITLPPTYGMYKVLADLNAVEDREVELQENFEPDVEQILQKSDSATKIIFLCSPNNPTGNSFSVEAIQELFRKFGGLIVIDEAYIDFSENEGFMGRLEEFPNLVITQTFSKAYGLAGIRLGICYASEEITEIVHKIKPPYNVNELSQQKAMERLRNQQEVQLEIEKILVQRKFLEKKLSEIEFVKKIYPSEANFILAKMDNADLRYNQLIERGIVVRNRSKQALCENCIRFTVGTLAENIRLVKALKEISRQSDKN